MLRNIQALWNDEAGFVVSAELVLVLTIGVLAMIVGLHSVAKSIVTELNDVSNAFGAIEQTYCYDGLMKPGHSHFTGSAYMDRRDDCDCSVIVQTSPPVKVDNSSGSPESGGRGGRGY